MPLYSLRTAPTGFTITKFDEDFNPVATYHLEPKGFSFTCDCPANSRPVVTKPCRHKLMMPNLLPYADTDRFFDYDTGEFCTPLGDPHRVPPEGGEAQPLVGEAVRAEAPCCDCQSMDECNQREGCQVLAIEAAMLEDEAPPSPAPKLFTGPDALFNLPQHEGVPVREVEALAQPVQAPTIRRR